MASLGRNQVFAVRGTVDHPTVLLLGTLTNRRGHVVASAYLTAEFPNPENPGFCMVTPHESAAAMVAAVGYTGTASNPGAVAGIDALQPLIAHAVRSAGSEMSAVFAAAEDAVTRRVEEWSRRAADWTHEAEALIQRAELRQRRVSVEEEQAIAARMTPERQLVRPSAGRRPAGPSSAPGQGRTRSWLRATPSSSARTGSASTTSPLTRSPQSFQAKVLEQRKAWDEADEGVSTIRSRFIAARGRLEAIAGRPAGRRRDGDSSARAVRRPARGPRLPQRRVLAEDGRPGHPRVGARHHR